MKNSRQRGLRLSLPAFETVTGRQNGHLSARAGRRIGPERVRWKYRRSACTGRVIVANYTPAHLEKLLIRIGLPEKEEWPEVTGAEHPEQALSNALAEIRQKGYVLHHDANGIAGFAAPLFREGHVAGAVGVYLPENRLSSPDAILRAVLDTASEINRKITLSV